MDTMCTNHGCWWCQPVHWMWAGKVLQGLVANDPQKKPTTDGVKLDLIKPTGIKRPHCLYQCGLCVYPGWYLLSCRYHSSYAHINNYIAVRLDQSSRPYTSFHFKTFVGRQWYNVMSDVSVPVITKGDATVRYQADPAGSVMLQIGLGTVVAPAGACPVLIKLTKPGTTVSKPQPWSLLAFYS